MAKQRALYLKEAELLKENPLAEYERTNIITRNLSLYKIDFQRLSEYAKNRQASLIL